MREIPRVSSSCPAEPGFGPHRIAWALGLARFTVYAVLRRCGLNRLDRLHRVTPQVVRHERAHASGLPHLDVKKSGWMSAGGGKRFAPGFRGAQSGPYSKRSLGVDSLHVAVADHGRRRCPGPAGRRPTARPSAYHDDDQPRGAGQRVSAPGAGGAVLTSPSPPLRLVLAPVVSGTRSANPGRTTSTGRTASCSPFMCASHASGLA